ncbi:uncharacterized protein LOC141682533 isoform X2 [Apium graveolens]|uniref:uncharacterized protein LOC141682533 isoform X2 n=1 Tax=Apium graveolens TaxID=4045 RepID=UPI003D7A8E3E
MAGSRRKLKRSRAKVKVGLPKKNPNVFKPAFNMPPKLVKLLDLSDTQWNDQASVIENYKTFGVVSNPNLLGVRSRYEKIVESDSLQVPPPPKIDGPVSEFETIDSGSDVEEDAHLRPLSSFQKDSSSSIKVQLIIVSQSVSHFKFSLILKLVINSVHIFKYRSTSLLTSAILICFIVELPL